MGRRKVRGSRRVREAIREARKMFPDAKVIMLPNGKLSIRWDEAHPGPAIGDVLAPIDQLREFLWWERPAA